MGLKIFGDRIQYSFKNNELLKKMKEMKKIILPIKNSFETYEINPSKIICLGRNYAEHAKELNNEVPTEPLLFIKSSNVLIGHNENIIIPDILAKIDKPRVDYEGELALIIGKTCKNVSRNDAYDYIYGFTCFNDVTARELQRSDIANKLPWFKSKSLDTFGPIGPSIVLKGDIDDPQKLKIETKLNGEVVQSANTEDMIFKIDYLIEYISSFFKLEEGDIVVTGTPSGIGPMNRGDTVEVVIEKIGVLKNHLI
jgi:2-keto-4-pentenoate hydratase/2-oxohepta-3-ene-1,7-dioic acid hydratase in catechol pathway